MLLKIIHINPQISNLLSSSLANTEKIDLIAPTDFMVPEFIKVQIYLSIKFTQGLNKKLLYSLKYSNVF